MKALLFTDIIKSETEFKTNTEVSDNEQEEVVKSDDSQQFNIMKTDDDKRLIFGWASIAVKVDGEKVIDHQKDMIDPEDLEEAVYEYVLNFRDGGEEHIANLRKKARLVESCMFTKEKMQAMGIPEGIVPEGWWIGFYVDDDEAWKKVKNGTYQMFSIEGQGIREEIDEEVEKGMRINGCGVLVVRDGKVLTGTRIDGKHKNQICGPGGHIENGEEPEEAAIREAYEEFGIECRSLKPLGLLDGGRNYGKSAIFLCTEFDGEPATDEEEMTDSKWRTIEELMEERLFKPFEQSLELLDEEEIIEKHNPYHDELGRFASSNGAGGIIVRSGKTSKAQQKRDAGGKLTEKEFNKIYYAHKLNLRENDNIQEQIKSIKSDGFNTHGHFNVMPADINDGIKGYSKEDLKNMGYTQEEMDFLKEKPRGGVWIEETYYPKVNMSQLQYGARKGDTVMLVTDADVEGGRKVKNGYKPFDYEIVTVERDFQPYYELYEKEYNARQNSSKQTSVAKTFDEVLKFNPYHDALGRFATANGYASFTMTTRDPNKQHWADKAIARMKQQAANAAPPKPKKQYDALGFANQDDADFHQLYNGKQYYAQQKLTPAQQKAANDYLSPYTEPGSLYSHCQNMNYMMATGQKLTGRYKNTHDGMMSAMHNIGYNVELTRYDHAGMLNGMLQSLGAGNNYEKMSQKALQKALIGATVSENKFLSTSYNGFKNAPQSTKQIFDSRAVKINYKVKADAQAMMPGKGPGGDFGEIVLAPTNGTANRAGKITGVRLTGKMVRRQGTQTYNQPRIEIDIEI